MQKEKIFKKKENGIGYTVNMKSTGGKVMAAVITLFIIGITIFSILLFTQIGSTAFTLTIDGHNAEVSASGMFRHRFNFRTDEIESIVLIDTFPNARRTNGTSTQHILSGRFDVTGYGPSRVYLHRNSPPFIVIELPDTWIFLNGETRVDTEYLLTKLNAVMR